MQTFKNKNFVKRDSECTQRVYCRAEQAPAAYWESIGDILNFPEGIIKLGSETANGATITYYGYL